MSKTIEKLLYAGLAAMEVAPVFGQTLSAQARRRPRTVRRSYYGYGYYALPAHLKHDLDAYYGPRVSKELGYRAGAKAMSFDQLWNSFNNNPYVKKSYGHLSRYAYADRLRNERAIATGILNGTNGDRGITFYGYLGHALNGTQKDAIMNGQPAPGLTRMERKLLNKYGITNQLFARQNAGALSNETFQYLRPPYAADLTRRQLYDLHTNRVMHRLTKRQIGVMTLYGIPVENGRDVETAYQDFLNSRRHGRKGKSRRAKKGAKSTQEDSSTVAKTPKVATLNLRQEVRFVKSARKRGIKLPKNTIAYLYNPKTHKTYKTVVPYNKMSSFRDIARSIHDYGYKIYFRQDMDKDLKPQGKGSQDSKNVSQQAKSLLSEAHEVHGVKGSKDTYFDASWDGKPYRYIFHNGQWIRKPLTAKDIVNTPASDSNQSDQSSDSNSSDQNSDKNSSDNSDNSDNSNNSDQSDSSNSDKNSDNSSDNNSSDSNNSDNSSDNNGSDNNSDQTGSDSDQSYQSDTEPASDTKSSDNNSSDNKQSSDKSSPKQSPDHSKSSDNNSNSNSDSPDNNSSSDSNSDGTSSDNTASDTNASDTDQDGNTSSDSNSDAKQAQSDATEQVPNGVPNIQQANAALRKAKGIHDQKIRNHAERVAKHERHVAQHKAEAQKRALKKAKKEAKKHHTAVLTPKHVAQHNKVAERRAKRIANHNERVLKYNSKKTHSQHDQLVHLVKQARENYVRNLRAEINATPGLNTGERRSAMRYLEHHLGALSHPDTITNGNAKKFVEIASQEAKNARYSEDPSKAASKAADQNHQKQSGLYTNNGLTAAELQALNTKYAALKNNAKDVQQGQKHLATVTSAMNLPYKDFTQAHITNGQYAVYNKPADLPGSKPLVTKSDLSKLNGQQGNFGKYWFAYQKVTMSDGNTYYHVASFRGDVSGWINANGMKSVDLSKDKSIPKGNFPVANGVNHAPKGINPAYADIYTNLVDRLATGDKSVEKIAGHSIGQGDDTKISHMYTSKDMKNDPKLGNIASRLRAYIIDVMGVPEFANQSLQQAKLETAAG